MGLHGRALRLACTAVGIAVVCSSCSAEHPGSAPDAMGLYKGSRGRYSLRYPVGWKVREKGSAVTITHPGRQVTLSAAPARQRRLKDATRELVRALAAQYRGLELAGTDVQSIGGRPAMLVGGTVRDRWDARLRFLVVTVKGERRNVSITVFTRQLKPSKITADVDAMIESVRIR